MLKCCSQLSPKVAQKLLKIVKVACWHTRDADQDIPWFTHKQRFCSSDLTCICQCSRLLYAFGRWKPFQAPKALHLFQLQPGSDLFDVVLRRVLIFRRDRRKRLAVHVIVLYLEYYNTGYPCWKWTHIPHIHIWNLSTHDTQPIKTQEIF